MAQTKFPSVLTISFRPPALRWLLVLPALVVLIGACFVVRWYVGNTVAEYSPAADEGGLDMARMAVRWAPGDPLAHWRLASFEEKNFSAESMARAVREYELAVKASPYDYRYWMELGRALSAAGEPENAEKALLRAVELAPAYSHPRWHYGNLLVRQGNLDQAFVHLARAAEADEAMQPQIFFLASQVYGGDVDAIAKVLPSAAVRLQFTINQINARKFDEASRFLGTISAADKKAHRELIEQVQKSLIAHKQFHAALSLMRELEPGSELPVPEKFWNGGFESAVPLLDPKPFRWVINSRPQAQISIDPSGQSTSGSLRIVFKAPTKLEKITVAQTIVVEPDTQYRLQFSERTDNLISAGTPTIVVSDSVDGSTLAASQAMPSGTNDWRQVSLDFKTKPKHEGIAIGIIRSACDDKEPICPIFGTVWYDDFNLQRVSGPSPSRRSAGSNSR